MTTATATATATEKLVNAVIETAINNVNNALCFYKKHPCMAMLINVEETVIENLTFAKLVADMSPKGEQLLNKLNELDHNIIHKLPIATIELTGE